ncbi:TLD-domain-containing protein [Morchella snyderi]|nr:TLD-domain-containing protein [Morchella snyderi]
MSTASASLPSIPGTITSALTWTFHRLTSDTSITPAAAAKKKKMRPASLPPALTSPSSSSFTPPPLAPLQITGYVPSTNSRLLSRALAEEIRLLLPPRLQLHENWTLAYSLEQHGVSLATLYRRGMKGSFVLVVKDSAGGIFGAFVNEPFHPSGRYYGTGECFLWKASILPTQKSASGTSTPDNTDRIRFKAFPYSGINDYMILCDNTSLSVGGGDGKYGLWLDDIFEKGVSQSCMTFGNEPLSEDGEKFEVIGVELWRIG